MAGPNARVTITGLLRNCETFHVTEGEGEERVKRDAARALVLTDDGGFLEVYIRPDDYAGCVLTDPGAKGTDVSFAADIYVSTRKGRNGPYSVLGASFVPAPVLESDARALVDAAFAPQSA